MKNPNILISHGWAHRLTNFGTLESAPVKVSIMKIEIDNSLWESRGASSMDLNGSDTSEIQSQLQRMNAIFYDDATRVPTSEQIEN